MANVKFQIVNHKILVPIINAYFSINWITMIARF